MVAHFHLRQGYGGTSRALPLRGFPKARAHKSREAASARQGAICITACERPAGREAGGPQA